MLLEKYGAILLVGIAVAAGFIVEETTGRLHSGLFATLVIAGAGYLFCFLVVCFLYFSKDKY